MLAKYTKGGFDLEQLIADVLHLRVRHARAKPPEIAILDKDALPAQVAQQLPDATPEGPSHGKAAIQRQPGPVQAAGVLHQPPLQLAPTENVVGCQIAGVDGHLAQDGRPSLLLESGLAERAIDRQLRAEADEAARSQRGHEVIEDGRRKHPQLRLAGLHHAIESGSKAPQPAVEAEPAFRSPIQVTAAVEQVTEGLQLRLDARQIGSACDV